MGQYISKDALVAEIKRRIKECDEHLETPSFYCGMESGLRASLDSIDTLEVKEVDEQKEQMMKKQ